MASGGGSCEGKTTRMGFFAEIISSIAVVISLLYVGYEIRQNSEQVRVANRQSIASRVEQLTLAVANNPDITGTLENEDPENLTQYRSRQLGNFNGAFFRNIEEAYLMYLEGQLSEEYWLTRVPHALVRMNDQATQNWWQGQKMSFTPRFREWLENELTQDQNKTN